MSSTATSQPTREQKRIKIAEAHGVVEIKPELFCPYRGAPMRTVLMGKAMTTMPAIEELDLPESQMLMPVRVPNYFKDRAALHVLLKDLSKTPGFALKFESHLNDLGVVFLWLAECEQLVEAVGRTLGLWEASR